MNTNDYTIRLEKKEDCRAVENLIRRSVKKMCRWHIFSVGRSGCAARREVTATRRLSHKRAGTLTAPTSAAATAKSSSTTALSAS